MMRLAVMIWAESCDIVRRVIPALMQRDNMMRF